jgi:anti-sigma regulatory factor (Ser/Thr protein kinase)
MKVPYEVVLPQVNVLGSTMAYREAGNPDAPVAPEHGRGIHLMKLAMDEVSFEQRGCRGSHVERAGK